MNQRQLGVRRLLFLAVGLLCLYVLIIYVCASMACIFRQYGYPLLLVSKLEKSIYIFSLLNHVFLSSTFLVCVCNDPISLFISIMFSEEFTYVEKMSNQCECLFRKTYLASTLK